MKVLPFSACIIGKELHGQFWCLDSREGGTDLTSLWAGFRCTYLDPSFTSYPQNEIPTLPCQKVPEIPTSFIHSVSTMAWMFVSHRKSLVGILNPSVVVWGGGLIWKRPRGAPWPLPCADTKRSLRPGRGHFPAHAGTLILAFPPAELWESHDSLQTPQLVTLQPERTKAVSVFQRLPPDWSQKFPSSLSFWEDISRAKAFGMHSFLPAAL